MVAGKAVYFNYLPYAAMLKGGLAFFAPFRVARRVWQGKSQGHSPSGSKKCVR